MSSPAEGLLRAQRKAAELYTAGVKPWLLELDLPWGFDGPPDAACWSAAAHVRWAMRPGHTSTAADLAAMVSALLSCCLALER